MVYSIDHKKSTTQLDKDKSHLTIVPPCARAEKRKWAELDDNRHLISEGGNNFEIVELVLRYGQELQDLYGDNSKFEVKQTLIEIFSVLAYHHPSISPLSFLLNSTRRDGIATKLNCHFSFSRPTINPIT